VLCVLLLGVGAAQRVTAQTAEVVPAAVDPCEAIGKAASVFSMRHFRRPDRIELVRTATRAVDEASGAEAPNAPPEGGA
jgi:hypothetical protein